MQSSRTLLALAEAFRGRAPYFANAIMYYNRLGTEENCKAVRKDIEDLRRWLNETEDEINKREIELSAIRKK